MKTEIVGAVKDVATRILSRPARKEAAAVTNTVKDGEKLMAAGQDAVAAQNKAMVYVKPEMDVVKMDKQNLKAASGGYGNYDRGSSYGGSDDLSSDIGGSGGSRANRHSIWDDAW